MKPFILNLLLSILTSFTLTQTTYAFEDLQFVEDPKEILAAEQITKRNLNLIYTDPTPAILFAIPVYKVYVDSNGKILNIEILRIPSNPDAYPTVQMGIEAIKQAEPFVGLSEDNQPVNFKQTFLFRDDLKFKLRVLDL